MSVAIVTGSGGLIGSQVSLHLVHQGLEVVGVDNDTRSKLFGIHASTRSRIEYLKKELAPKYRHFDFDIRDLSEVTQLFESFNKYVHLVVHTAGQPSHDWSANYPVTDFDINAMGTLRLLEAHRQFCPEATFVFMSTNKVYGDLVNTLRFDELPTRWEPSVESAFYEGIDETFSIDRSMHSPFGVSKAAADLMVQEYGKYYRLRTVCLRGGCLTGAAHRGARLHGFLAYLMKCVMTGSSYTIYGYKGKQVRDNVHAIDVADAIWKLHNYNGPLEGEVFNIGGGRHSNCSIIEAIDMCEKIVGRHLNYSYQELPRIGDHRWWISDTEKLEEFCPDWKVTLSVRDILEEMYREWSNGV